MSVYLNIEELRQSLNTKPVESTNVPTHFSVLLRLRAAIADHYAPTKKVVEVLSAEPVIAAKLIQTANSAATHNQGTVLDIESAVFRLGLETVRRVALAVTMQQLAKSKELLAFSGLSRGLWLNGLYASAAATVVADEYRDQTDINPVEAGFCALMLNLGGFYILYRAAQHRALHGAADDVRDLTTTQLLSQTKQMVAMIGLPEELMAAITLDDVLDIPAKEPPRTMTDIVYTAYLLANHRFNWRGRPSSLELLAPHIVDLISKIELRYDSLRAEYI